MAGDFFSLQPFNEIGQTVAACVQVGVVNLFRIAGENDLGPLTNASHEGLNHVGRKILSFITDHKLLGNRSSPNIGQGLHFQDSPSSPVLQHIGGILTIPQKELKIIVNGLHPGPQFVLLSAGEETQIVAHGGYRTSDKESAVGVLFDNLFESHGEGKEGLSRPGAPNKGNDLDLIIQQELEGKPLFFVVRFDAPVHGIGVNQRPEGVLEVTGKRRLRRVVMVPEQKELVG